VMAFSFLVGGVIPLAPFVFGPLDLALALAVVLTGAALFAVGVFKGRLAGQSMTRSGLEFLVIALIATGIGYAIGFVIEQFTGVAMPAS
jgi:predicted membrane protein (TIGR00267 family)